ncbi:Sfi1 spindle body protein-domain-containing protein [Coniella lustricola]|uniref:Sfi1 spindle body protein-domain-containing protein n=1 Tax=Coniella lustricola TaxID=2025994 RepID=A0A2T3ADW0_9PEZI|nr:Sfi1 spindle body protein-domain-containing protein [Coniella lustricola]
MPPLPASALTGGSTPTPTPSNETGDSETFTDNAEDEPQVRGTDDSSVPVKLDPVITVDDDSTIDLMPAASEATPPPDGPPDDGDRGDPGATLTNPRPKQESDYSNEDIALVHEIIATAQHNLASIPERDRNPAEALYAAADEVLPRHGLVPEEVPHIARLLFSIGAKRGSGSLYDKFKASLSEYHIELEFTETSLASIEPSPQEDIDTSDVLTPRAPSAPRDNLQHDAPMETAGSGPSSIASHASPRRRDSDSLRVDLDTNNPQRGSVGASRPAAAAPVARPASTDRVGFPKKEVRFSDVVDSQSLSEISWDQEPSSDTFSASLPFRPKLNIFEGQNTRLSEMQSAGAQHQDDVARPATRADNRPPSDFSRLGESKPSFSSHLTDQSSRGDTPHPDEDFSSVSFDLAGLREAEDAERPDLGRPRLSSQPAGIPSDSEDSDSDSDNDKDDSRHGNAPPSFPPSRGRDEPALPQEPPERELTAKEALFVKHFTLASSLDHWRNIHHDIRHDNIRFLTHAKRWDVVETISEVLEIWIESARTLRIDEYDGIRAYQDHLRQRKLERSQVSPPRRVEDLAMPLGSVHQRVGQSIEHIQGPYVSAAAGRRVPASRNVEGHGRQQPQPLERTPGEEASNRSMPQRGTEESRLRGPQPGMTQGEPAVASGYVYDNIYDASEELESEDNTNQAEDTGHSHYQVATAAWNYFLLSKAFTHWADCADEEVERTQIARRHILRKKCYQAWVRDTDETEAESKAIWFMQMSTIKQWRAKALSAARRSLALGRIAAGLEKVDVTEEVMFEWYHASKKRLAERMDAHYLVSGCLEDWQSQDVWLGSAYVEADAHFRGSMLGRFVQYWQGEAQVQRRAEAGAGPVIARRDEFLRSGLSLAWRQEAEAVRTREKTAVAHELREFTRHWMYEDKVVALQHKYHVADLEDICYHWYLEWRLQVAERTYERLEKTRLLEKWEVVSSASAARSYHLRHLAQDLRVHDTITGFFNTALEGLEYIEEQAEQARGIVIRRLVPKVLKNWTAELSHHYRLNRWSYLSNLLHIGQEILPEWQLVRRQQFYQRMHRLYSDCRYRAHLSMVKDSLDTWRQATAHAVTKSWEADDMCIEDDAAMVYSMVRAWRSKHELVAFTGQIAAEADMESYLMQWTSMYEAQRESQLDGLEIDFAQTAGSSWDEWTLACIALRGHEQTVREFKSHNGRRTVRHLFTSWVAATEAVVDRVPEMDFRTTRRGSRWGTPASAVARTAAARLVRSTGSVHPVGQTTVASSSNNTTSHNHNNILNKAAMTPLVFRTPARPNLLFRGSSFRQSSTTPAYRPPSDMTFEERDETERMGEMVEEEEKEEKEEEEED